MNRSSQVRVFGLIPAAGWSRRMGKPKQLLPWGRATILETVMDTVGAGGVDGLVVVTHSRIMAALELTSTRQHAIVVLDDPNAEMLASIIAGARRLQARYDAAPHDAFLVCPGDLPRMTASIVQACVSAARRQPGRVVAAHCAGRARHPIVVPFDRLDRLDGLRGQGLRGLLTEAGEPLERVAISDETPFGDIDTPADYDPPVG
jgi:molybdenum cofactor cytidylyltransferase